MPCHDNYPPTTELNDRVYRAARHYVGVAKAFNKPIPANIRKARNDNWSNDLTVEPALCALMHEVSKDAVKFDAFMLGNNDYDLRDLGKWWDEHRVIDAIREGKETPLPGVYKRLYETALKKLMRHEAIILGCVDKWDAVHNFTPSTETQSEEDTNAHR